MTAPVWAEWLGYAAATLTTAAFVPQAWLTFRSRDVSGISLCMYSVFTAGVGLWLAYGWVLQSWPIVVANVVTLVLALCILLMKLLMVPQGQTKPGKSTARRRYRRHKN
jgi:MtN3 and saliva related transmembrane protein